MALTKSQYSDMIGPTRRMSAWDTAPMAWVPPKAVIFTPVGPDWPAPAVDATGTAYPPAIADDGPFTVSEFLKTGLRNADLATGLDRLESELRAKARGRETYLGVTVLPGDLNWTYPNLEAALQAVGTTAAGATRAPAAEVTHHLLRDTLLDRLQAKGFSLDAPVVPLGLLADPVFYDPMTLRRHMKDVLVGQDHGEWTHMLQWYLLATASDLRRGNAAAEVFEYLGRQGVAQYTEPKVSRRLGANLWRICCDRDAPYIHKNGSPAKDTDDCRNPDMLHLALAGFAPVRQASLETTLGVFGSGPVFQSFAQIRDAWFANRRRWPFLCVLLRRRALKREPLYLQLGRLTEDLKAEVRQRIAAFLPLTGVNVATSNLDRFFLEDFFKTPESGLVDVHPEHLSLPLGHTFSAAGYGFLIAQINLVINEYGRYFYRANPDAIPYGWARLHRRDPVNVPAPPAAPAQALTQFRALDPALQGQLCLYAKNDFRP